MHARPRKEHRPQQNPNRSHITLASARSVSWGGTYSGVFTKVFTGYDSRESIGWHVFAHSVIETTKGPVNIIPLAQKSQGDGSNAFTYSRFLVPELMNFGGFAIFVDAADMLLKADLTELWNLRDKNFAVQVVKHDYQTKFGVKYQGTELETENRSYPRKNWSSVVIWNCGHVAHFKAREKLRSKDGAYLHRFGWLEDNQIGDLPIEWGWLADEYGENPKAKLLHWTAGIPGFTHYSDSPHADEWKRTMLDVNKGMQYQIRLNRNPEDSARNVEELGA